MHNSIRSLSGSGYPCGLPMAVFGFIISAVAFCASILLPKGLHARVSLEFLLVKQGVGVFCLLCLALDEFFSTLKQIVKEPDS